MKTSVLLVVATLLAGAWAVAQTKPTTNAAPALTLGITGTNAPPAQAVQAIDASSGPHKLELDAFVIKAKPNEIPKGRITLSGSAVQAVKGKNFLQLVNPFAPADYGSGWDNVAWNPIDGRAAGLKLFAIQF